MRSAPLSGASSGIHGPYILARALYFHARRIPARWTKAHGKRFRTRTRAVIMIPRVLETGRGDAFGQGFDQPDMAFGDHGADLFSITP